MMERGFLELKTFRDLVNGRGTQRLITLSPNQTVSEAIDLMKKYDIENIPVAEAGVLIGSISENGLFDKILNNPEIKNQPVSAVMEKPYPEVAYDTPVERLSHFITKENRLLSILAYSRLETFLTCLVLPIYLLNNMHNA